MAEWLNTTFYGLDSGVFSAMHGMAEKMGGVLTPLSKIITLFAEKGLVFFLAGVILMLFPKTRKLGICMFGAVACGALVTNIALKNVVERVRPIEHNAQFHEVWESIGSPAHDGFCFPSGHVTAITAAAVSLFIFCSKKWSWVGFLGVIFMGFARVYLIHHYFTDVLAGIIVGAVSGIIAFFITKLIYFLLEKNSEKKFCDLCLNANVKNLFRRK